MATQKPFKMSNYVSFNRQRPENYVRDLDRDIQKIVTYLNTFPPVYTQSAQPTITTDSVAFWKDSDDDKFYLLLDVAGTTKKVELT